MGVLRAMWSLISGRRHAREAEQLMVDKALASQRRETFERVRGIEDEVRHLRGAEAVMMEYLSRTAAESSRTKRKSH